MKEHPILFSASMVCAILAGTKTQTRRVMKPQPKNHGLHLVAKCHIQRCPFQIGQRLWVREAFSWGEHWPNHESSSMTIRYHADSADYLVTEGIGVEDRLESPPNHGIEKRIRPSIHMPWWACRIYLEVKEIRIEQVRSITEKDAKEEGVDSPPWLSHRDSFARLWDEINSRRGFGWDTNPWVWVITFDRMV